MQDAVTEDSIPAARGKSRLARSPVAAVARLAIVAAVAAALATPVAAADRVAAGKTLAVANGGTVRAGPLSSEASQTLARIVESGDNLDLPFLIIDKVHARVSAFDAAGNLQASSAALIGLGRGDSSPAGIGQRRLADIAPSERTTPAGRFIAGLGNDLGEADVLWVDYENAISLHRVVAGTRKERRHQRLASPSVEDNRISYGCINVPVEFFEQIVLKLFDQTNGIVYILPETAPASEFFSLPSSATQRGSSAAAPSAQATGTPGP